MTNERENSGYGFGTFQGVFTPSILTIIGVIVYMRFGWMLGNVGLAASLVIVTLGSVITFLTGLSISALATNMRVKGGGAYFMLSRSLGLEAGGAIGIPLALSQTIGISFYVVGFAEALVTSGLPVVSEWDPRLVGLATLLSLALVSSLSARLAMKLQYVIMAAIALSFVSFFAGGAPASAGAGGAPAGAAVAGAVAGASATGADAALGFWPVFAVFFPAVTGILAGVGMSGDLRNPGKSIPLGTIAAVLVGYAVYMAVPIALNAFVADAETLRADTMILQHCARYPALILLGVWAATLSSAVGSFLIAPRAVQALARDRLLPAFLGRGGGKTDDPRVAALVCVAVAGVCIWFGNINALAPVLTLFHLSTYALLNFCACVEEVMANPSWRPTFRVHSFLALVGFILCVIAMFMISPGWTFVALGCEMLIYYLVKRRELTTQWGDMRTGLYVALARFAFRKLATLGYDERNWRPNFLAFVPPATVNPAMLGVVRDISGGKSLVTIASVLPEGDSGGGAGDAAGERGALADALRREARRHDLEAEVRTLQAAQPWDGMAELVRSYGFGAIVPNTVIIGEPHRHSRERISEFVRLIHSQRRNLMVFGNRTADTSADANLKYIDLWWRGSGNNGFLMLAVAYLLNRNDLWRGRRLRVNMIFHHRTTDEVKGILAEKLRDARISAETRTMDSCGRSFAEIIAEHSADAALTFIGIRLPEAEETTAAYGDYIIGLTEKFASVPQPVYVLAAENIDFIKIFT